MTDEPPQFRLNGRQRVIMGLCGVAFAFVGVVVLMQYLALNETTVAMGEGFDPRLWLLVSGVLMILGGAAALITAAGKRK